MAKVDPASMHKGFVFKKHNFRLFTTSTTYPGLGVSRSFASDTSPKSIDREGLAKRRTGQHVCEVRRKNYSGALVREARASEAPWVSKFTHPRKFGNHVTVH